MTVPNGAPVLATATCLAGERPIGGGPFGLFAPAGCVLVYSYPTDNGWVSVMRCDGYSVNVAPQVVCLATTSAP